MGIIIYLVGGFWLVFIAALVWKDRLRAAVHPLVQFGVAQIVYFSQVPTHQVMEVGLLHVLTTVSILGGFYIIRGGEKIGGEQLRFIKIDRRSTQIGFLGVALSVCLIVPLLALTQGISLFDILTSFYTFRGMARVPALVAYFLTGMTKIPFIAIILGRIWFHVTPSPVIRTMWRILFVTQLILTFGSGVRSGLVFLFACVILADAYVLAVLGYRVGTLAIVRMRTAYVVLLGAMIFGVGFLSAFRSRTFRNFADIKAAASQLVAGQAGGESVAKAAQQELNEAVGFVVAHYSANPRTLHGIYAQLVNVVPRAVWPGKPVGFGKVLAHDMVGTPYDEPLSLAAGIGGEGFFNLGWMGVVIFPFLFGVGGAWIYKKVIRSPDPGFVACLLIYIAWGTGISRGDWLSSINVITYQVVVFFPVMIVLRTLLGSTQLMQYHTKWARPVARNDNPYSPRINAQQTALG